MTQQRHADVVQEAPPRPKGVVDLEEFDSTLYFLDESEINYVATEVEAEYKRDVRASALNVLFDLVELEGDTDDPQRDHRHPGVALPQFPQRARLPHRGRWCSGRAKVVASRAPGLAAGAAASGSTPSSPS